MRAWSDVRADPQCWIEPSPGAEPIYVCPREWVPAGVRVNVLPSGTYVGQAAIGIEPGAIPDYSYLATPEYQEGVNGGALMSNGIDGIDGIAGSSAAPDVFYGDISAPVTVAAGGLVLALLRLIQVIGEKAATMLWPVLRSAAGAGGRFTAASWAQLPNWARQLLIAAGITAGTEFTLELAGTEGLIPGMQLIPGGETLPTIPGVTGVTGVSGAPGLAGIIGYWDTAPGDAERNVRFYRLADGRIACQNRKGRWRVWRPRRPIVLFAGGAGNLRTLLRAEHYITGQLKRIDKAIARIGQKPRKARVRVEKVEIKQ